MPSTDSRGLSDLVRDLGRDTGELVRQEIALAKMELSGAISTMLLDSVQILVALLVAGIGGIALVVAAILGIGTLLGGAYWAGALITGALLVLVGGVIAGRAVRELKRTSLKPEVTLETLRTDSRWARSEAKELGRGLTG